MNINNYVCIDNQVISYKKGLYGLDVLYYNTACKNNVIPVNISNITPISCGYTNGFLSRTNVCNLGMSYAQGLMRNQFNLDTTSFN